MFFCTSSVTRRVSKYLTIRMKILTCENETKELPSNSVVTSSHAMYVGYYLVAECAISI